MSGYSRPTKADYDKFMNIMDVSPGHISNGDNPVLGRVVAAYIADRMMPIDELENARALLDSIKRDLSRGG